MSKKPDQLRSSSIISREDLEDEILDDLSDFKFQTDEKLESSDSDGMETEEEDGLAEFLSSILEKIETLVNAKALTDHSVRTRIKYLLKQF